MNTGLSTKFAALAVALMMNSVLLCGVAFVFSSHIKPHSADSRNTTTWALEVA